MKITKNTCKSPYSRLLKRGEVFDGLNYKIPCPQLPRRLKLKRMELDMATIWMPDLLNVLIPEKEEPESLKEVNLALSRTNGAKSNGCCHRGKSVPLLQPVFGEAYMYCLFLWPKECAGTIFSSL